MEYGKGGAYRLAWQQVYSELGTDFTRSGGDTVPRCLHWRIELRRRGMRLCADRRRPEWNGRGRKNSKSS